MRLCLSAILFAELNTEDVCKAANAFPQRCISKLLLRVQTSPYCGVCLFSVPWYLAFKVCCKGAGKPLKVYSRIASPGKLKALLFPSLWVQQPESITRHWYWRIRFPQLEISACLCRVINRFYSCGGSLDLEKCCEYLERKTLW